MEKLIHQPSITVLDLPVHAEDQNKIVLASSLFLSSFFVVAALFSRVCSYYLCIVLVI